MSIHLEASRESALEQKVLNEMTGDPWNLAPQPKDKAPQVYTTLERQIKYGGTKGCSACFGQAKVRSPECRARFHESCTDSSCERG